MSNRGLGPGSELVTRRTRSVGFALFAFLAASTGLLESGKAQEPPPAFPARIEQVTVDVVVADKTGSPITGLKEGDLEVYENGVRQTIVSFDAVEVAADRKSTRLNSSHLGISY